MKMNESNVESLASRNSEGPANADDLIEIDYASLAQVSGGQGYHEPIQ